MNSMRPPCFVGVLLALAACSEPVPERPAAEPPAASASEPVTFVNKVWMVSERSDGADLRGLYVFLSDGTLVLSSPNATPALGTWREDGDGMTMVEEGIAYDVDVLELTDTRFRIRMHSPGGPLEIAFVLAATS